MTKAQRDPGVPVDGVQAWVGLCCNVTNRAREGLYTPEPGGKEGGETVPLLEADSDTSCGRRREALYGCF